MADAITIGNDIDLWSANIPEEMQKYLLRNETGSLWPCDETLLLRHDVPQHRKKKTRQWKCTTNLLRRQNHNGEVVDRSWLRFSPSQTCVYCFTLDWFGWMRLHVRISWLEKESTTGSTLLSVWGATSNQWNIQMPRLHLVADVIKYYEELIQN